MENRPHSPSCDQNREPILMVLEPRLLQARRLLEIGSGTGQHAAWFAPRLPWLDWQTSDVAENLAGIRAWLTDVRSGNAPDPIVLDVLDDAWPDATYQAAFSANTAHIMHEAAVAAMFAGVGSVLEEGGRFFLYGPFNRDGRYTAESNREFDFWLRARDAGMGVRDMAWLDQLAAAAGMTRTEAVAMPADNFVLIWERRADGRVSGA
jgi:cyclopropane fatty-acyl-phospholipid synthase-like methyltransferase